MAVLFIATDDWRGNDSPEMENLADDPAHAETVAKMKALLPGDWTKARAP